MCMGRGRGRGRGHEAKVCVHREGSEAKVWCMGRGRRDGACEAQIINVCYRYIHHRVCVLRQPRVSHQVGQRL